MRGVSTTSLIPAETAARVGELLAPPVTVTVTAEGSQRYAHAVGDLNPIYFDEAAAGTPRAFDLRVRPALDSPSAALDRVKMFVYEQCARRGLPCPVTGHASGKVASEMAEAAGGGGGGGGGE